MMTWAEHKGADVTAAFIGFSAPTKELYDEIHRRGWTVQKVQTKDHAFQATGKNPHGEKLEATGPNEQTVLGNLLGKIMRREHIRSSAQYKVGMWDTTFEGQLQEIAQAYAEAPIYDAKAAAAWIELAHDSTNRAQVLQTQLQVEVVDDPHPYKTADELREDVKEKKHIFVTRAYAHHPVWSIDQMVAFRLVHDVLGHCVGGGDWGWHGENLACAAHFPLLSPEAQKALFAESLGQTAYQNVYRQWGPQKIAFLDELIEKVQEKENSADHHPVHPSQSLAPAAVPNLQKDEATPTKEAASTVHPQSKERTAATLTDPNAGWQSGIEPLPDSAYLWQREPSTLLDPLDSQGVMEGVQGLDPRLSTLPYPLARQAVSNAFRSVLMAPRKSAMHQAQHYQHLAGIPADVDDPLIYWNALEEQRRQHNTSRGLPVPMLPFQSELQQFKQWVKTMNPRMHDGEVQERASRELLHMLQEEEERVLAEDKDEKLSAGEVELLAYQNLQKRIKNFTKPTVDNKRDFGDSALYKEATVGPYGSYLASHLRPITGVARHADELADAALEDIHEHNGTGHHFRSTALGLGIPGLSPRVASSAWLHLNPNRSQLAVLDPHVLESLGRDHSELSDRDYFKFERELGAGRDAAGYNHVPLGAFSLGMHDYALGGHGFHQDYSPMRVLNPAPFENIDWLSRQTGDGSWSNPYWWDSTQQARDAVGDDWDQVIAINHAKDSIPFQHSSSALDQPAPAFTHEETGIDDVGAPGESLMNFIKMNLGLNSVHDVWALQGLSTRKIR